VGVGSFALSSLTLSCIKFLLQLILSIFFQKNFKKEENGMNGPYCTQITLLS
jgi:hypothetical protein